MADEINFEVTGFGELRKQLREAQLEMIKLAAAGKEGTEEFLKAAQKAGQLKEAIKDASESAQVFTTEGKFQAVTKGLASITGGFTAVQGAIGLVSSDSKAFQETLLKIQSALALTQGLTALADLGDAFKNLKSVAVSAFNGIKAAIGSSGIGILLLGLGAAAVAVISNLEELQAAFGGVSKEVKDFNEELDKNNIKLAQAGKDAMATATLEVNELQNAFNGVREAGLDATSVFGDIKKQLPELAALRLTDANAQTKINEALNRYTVLIGYQAELTANLNVLKQKQLDLTKATDLYLNATADADKKALKASTDRLFAEINAIREKNNQINKQVAILQTARGKEIDSANAILKTEEENERKRLEREAKKKRDDEERRKNDLRAEETLAESKRELYEAQAEGERDLLDRKYKDDQARLEEQKTKELNAENVSEDAKIKIREKYANKLLTLTENYNDAVKVLDDKAAKDLEDTRKKSEEDFKSSSEKEYNDRKKAINTFYNEEEIAIRKSTDSDDVKKKKLLQNDLDRLDAQKINAQDYVETVEGASDDVVEIELDKQQKLDDITQEGVEADKKAQLEKVANFQEYADQVLSIAQGVTDAFAAQLQMQQQQEEEAVKASTQSEDQKAKAIDDIKRKYFEKNKSIEIANAIISSISGALNAFVSTLKFDPTGITGSILAAAALATGYFQVEKIRATTYQSSLDSSSNKSPQGSMYAEGGLLTGRSHNLGGIKTSMGELEGGEFVMNRRATANFLPLLQAINSQGNTPGPQIGQYQQQVVKTYVVASDMTSQQEANAKLNALARL